MPSKVEIIRPRLRTEKFVDYPKYSTPSTNRLPPITIFLAGIFSQFLGQNSQGFSDDKREESARKIKPNQTINWGYSVAEWDPVPTVISHQISFLIITE